MRGWDTGCSDVMVKMAADGHSAGRIAAHFCADGVETTRNAIIGKLFRLRNPDYEKERARAIRNGLPLPVPVRSPKAPKLPQQPRRSPLQITAQILPFPVLPRRRALVKSTLVYSNAAQAFIDLRRDQCRYINGDPKELMAFCEESKRVGSYCRHHHELTQREWVNAPKIQGRGGLLQRYARYSLR